MTTTPTHADLEERIQTVGRSLHERLDRIVQDPAVGGAALARTLGLDKVFASRLLKSLRGSEPASVLHGIPGPVPLRRFLDAAERQGAAADDVALAASAVDDFERLIRDDLGGRSSLTTILSSWLPEARAEFESRRKQSAFKAQSELKGISCDLNLSGVFLHPSSDGERIDVVWLIGHLGIRRLRPGGRAKFATRRIVDDGSRRRPMTLEGETSEGFDRGRLDSLCALPPAHLEAAVHGNAVHYTLAGDQYGPRSAVDLFVAEVNREELPRFVPEGSGRRGYVFSEVPIPARALVFDVFVHEDLYPGAPQLLLYDTALNGVADINDPSRDIDRLDMVESVQALGRGSSRARVSEAPRYVDGVRRVFDSMEWDEDAFSAYRTRIDYPLYGSQVAFVFDAPAR